MTDNQDRQFSQDQSDRQRRQDQQDGRPSPQGQQQQQDDFARQTERGERTGDMTGSDTVGQGGGAEQYGMESERSRDQQQQEAGHVPKIDQDQVKTMGDESRTRNNGN